MVASIQPYTPHSPSPSYPSFRQYAPALPVVVVRDEDDTHDRYKKSLLRDTALRYIGYVNELGEAFKMVIPASLYRGSYAVAGLYAAVDSVDESRKAFKINEKQPFSDRVMHAFAGLMDGGAFHALATILVPPLFIEKIRHSLEDWLKHGGKTMLQKTPVLRWLPIAASLASIPFIVKPIDMGTEVLLDKTIRPLVHRHPHFIDGHTWDSYQFHHQTKLPNSTELIYQKPIQRSQYLDSLFA